MEASVFVIRRPGDNRFWQTSRGFIAASLAEATKYRDRTEATNARDMCCPLKAAAVVDEVRS